MQEEVIVEGKHTTLTGLVSLFIGDVTDLKSGLAGRAITVMVDCLLQKITSRTLKSLDKLDRLSPGHFHIQI
jgi:hypothetical protein